MGGSLSTPDRWGAMSSGVSTVHGQVPLRKRLQQGSDQPPDTPAQAPEPVGKHQDSRAGGDASGRLSTVCPISLLGALKSLYVGRWAVAGVPLLEYPTRPLAPHTNEVLAAARVPPPTPALYRTSRTRPTPGYTRRAEASAAANVSLVDSPSAVPTRPISRRAGWFGSW